MQPQRLEWIAGALQPLLHQLRGSIRSAICELSHCCVASSNAPGPRRLFMFCLLLYGGLNAGVWDIFSLPSILCQELQDGVCFRLPHCRVPSRADGLRPPAVPPETVGPRIWHFRNHFLFSAYLHSTLRPIQPTQLAAPLACSSNCSVKTCCKAYSVLA